MWWWLACRSPSPSAAADTVLYGATFRTMDPAGPAVAEALALRRGRIVAVGREADARAAAGRRAEWIDLDGATVLPGFTDAHNHLLWSGADLQLVDLYAARDLDDLAQTVIAWADAHPDEPWVQGGGWDLTTFLHQLDRAVLDAIVPDRPAYLYSGDAHSAVANSLGLAAAGIGPDSPEPEDGQIVRDADGVPTGLLLEGAMDLVTAVLPPYSDPLADSGLAYAQFHANALGLTTVVDPMVEPWMLAGYLRADLAGKLTVRVHGAAYVDAADPDPVPAIEDMRATYASEHLEVDAGKLFLDGVIETGTAVLVDPYVDGSNGVPVFDQERLESSAIALDAAGFQLHAHAIGDGAVRQLLDAIEAVEVANGPRDRRPLAAHLELVDPADVPRFLELGVLADVQALWAWPDTYVTRLTVPVVGEERGARLYPIGTLADSGATVVGGSDWSVTSQDPLLAIEVMVRRQNPWRDAGEVLGDGEELALDAALRAYTADGARASFSEDDLGTLTVGKLADLVALDRDPYAVPSEDLSDLVVRSTWLAGVPVYTRGVSAPPPLARASRCPDPRDGRFGAR